MAIINDLEKDMIKIKYNLKMMQMQKTVQTMMENHLLKEWVPEYTYQGCDRTNVVKDHYSALAFIFKMYGKTRMRCLKNKIYLKEVNEMISTGISMAKTNFKRRQKALLELAAFGNISESRIKKAISSNLIDFFKYDKNGAIHSIKLCDKIP